MGGYRSWKDLVEPEPKVEPPEALDPGPVSPDERAASQPAARTAPTPSGLVAQELSALLAARDAKKPPTLESLLEQGLLPPDVEAALSEYHGIRRQLDQLTGRSKADSASERQRRCFPVEVHTKDSRIAQRRARGGEERERQSSQRIQQDRVVERRRKEREEERQDQRSRTRRVFRAMRDRNRRKNLVMRLDLRLRERRRRAEAHARVAAHQAAILESERELASKLLRRQGLERLLAAIRRERSYEERERARRREVQAALLVELDRAEARLRERLEQRQRSAQRDQREARAEEARLRARLDLRQRSALVERRQAREEAAKLGERFDSRQRSALVERKQARAEESKRDERLDAARERSLARRRDQETYG